MAEALLGDGSLKGKLFLVTGGTGFLGYHLIQRVRKWSRNFDPSPKAKPLRFFLNFQMTADE
jgi:hypothetical protein